MYAPKFTYLAFVDGSKLNSCFDMIKADGFLALRISFQQPTNSLASAGL